MSEARKLAAILVADIVGFSRFTSSFAYRGRAVDVNQVARELGIRYVLEGSESGVWRGE